MADQILFFIEVVVGGLLAGTMYSLVALGFGASLISIFGLQSSLFLAKSISGLRCIGSSSAPQVFDASINHSLNNGREQEVLHQPA